MPLMPATHSSHSGRWRPDTEMSPPGRALNWNHLRTPTQPIAVWLADPDAGATAVLNHVSTEPLSGNVTVTLEAAPVHQQLSSTGLKRKVCPLMFSVTTQPCQPGTRLRQPMERHMSHPVASLRRKPLMLPVS
jgi:hypothetical protein